MTRLFLPFIEAGLLDVFPREHADCGAEQGGERQDKAEAVLIQAKVNEALDDGKVRQEDAVGEIAHAVEDM